MTDKPTSGWKRVLRLLAMFVVSWLIFWWLLNYFGW